MYYLSNASSQDSQLVFFFLQTLSSELPYSTFASRAVRWSVFSPRMHLNLEATRFGCCIAPDSSFFAWLTLLVWSFIFNATKGLKTFSKVVNTCLSSPLRRNMNSRDSWKTEQIQQVYILIFYFYQVFCNTFTIPSWHEKKICSSARAQPPVY